MFKLRKEHLEAFEVEVVRQFAGRVIAHVEAVWPGECAELGDATVAALVRSSIQRATVVGLQTELDIVSFVDLDFILVKDFDTNPLSGWSRPILADRKLGPTEKLQRLYARMEEEFALVEKRKGRSV
jgi:hypothetical protein